MLRELLDELGLVPFVMTTGSRGFHVVVALDRNADFDTVRRFARDVAGLVASNDPQRLTTEPRKSKRRGRVFIDYLRNGYAQTAVPPYAVRARPGAPVATPIDWTELDDPELKPDGFTLRGYVDQMAMRADPWRGMGRHTRSLSAPSKRLNALLAQSPTYNST